ncbi:uncharacterized protein LOC116290454 isoform X2 [Actinia tenebrosa]|uniref:Uncharacterized protein LOC116290454 isoform X2 n=1 Tax=Actinia tenebrosa TaxID=6105 RepID=A0A6P8HKX1_ACTTE|nr:uncharacterized protein LOC116290454 isoform X2 [Actinia tenebrosa]
MKFLVTLVFIAALYFCAESTTYPNHLTLKENVFDVHWYVNTTEDRFYFKVVANTTGWVGLAFTTYEGGEGMKDYDIALGGVRKENETYLKDYWSTSEVKPILDSSQDLMLTSAMESNGKTTIEFNRKADTGDAADTPLKMNNSIFLA